METPLLPHEMVENPFTPRNGGESKFLYRSTHQLIKSNSSTKVRPSFNLVELTGIEPATSSLRTTRSPR